MGRWFIAMWRSKVGVLMRCVGRRWSLAAWISDFRCWARREIGIRLSKLRGTLRGRGKIRFTRTWMGISDSREWRWRFAGARRYRRLRVEGIYSVRGIAARGKSAGRNYCHGECADGGTGVQILFVGPAGGTLPDGAALRIAVWAHGVDRRRLQCDSERYREFAESLFG